MIVWLLVLLVGAAVGSSAFSVLSSDFGAGSATESGQVAERLDALATTGGEIAIVIDGVDIDDPTVTVDVAGTLDRIRATEGVIDVTDYWSTGSDQLRGASDGRAALAVVTFAGGLDEEAELELADDIADVAREIDAPSVLVGGNLLVGEQFETALEKDLLRGEAIALPIAVFVMVLLFGGLIAAGMPLLVAFQRCRPVTRRSRRRDRDRRRVDFLGERRQHARHRTRHRLRVV